LAKLTWFAVSNKRQLYDLNMVWSSIEAGLKWLLSVTCMVLFSLIKHLDSGF